MRTREQHPLVALAPVLCVGRQRARIRGVRRACAEVEARARGARRSATSRRTSARTRTRKRTCSAAHAAARSSRRAARTVRCARRRARRGAARAPRARSTCAQKTVCLVRSRARANARANARQRTRVATCRAGTRQRLRTRISRVASQLVMVTLNTYGGACALAAQKRCTAADRYSKHGAPRCGGRLNAYHAPADHRPKARLRCTRVGEVEQEQEQLRRTSSVGAREQRARTLGAVRASHAAAMARE